MKLSEQQCTGLTFKPKLSCYINKRGDIVQTIVMTELRRQSCSCLHCHILRESQKECCANGNFPDLSNIDPEKLYTLAITYESRDFETGIVDAYTIDYTIRNKL